MIKLSFLLLLFFNIVTFIFAESATNETDSFTVEYVLFTQSNSNNGLNVTRDNEQLFNQSFNPKNPTRFLAHGWCDDRNSPDITVIRDTYLNRSETYNIFVIDWSEESKKNYIEAANATMEVGKQVAKFIEYLHKHFDLNLNNTYLIGHSLGAHVVGIAGKHIPEHSINTIFGLDPASPLFSVIDSSRRLAKGDAQYVETIHTDGSFKGFLFPIGNTSFYVNYGKTQPGCTDLLGSCSHARAYEYFAESLNIPNEFIAEQCSSFVSVLVDHCQPTGKLDKMGGDPSNYGRNVSGIYYLPTRAESPYALGSSWLKS